MIKGILLAGGRGTRLYPLSAIVSKQLQPIYNKPVIYYSLTTVMVAGVRDILLISTPEDIPRFRTLMGDGTQWGIRIEYAVQKKARGIAEALVIGSQFIGDDSTLLMLGDNFIYGRLDFLREAVAQNGDGATIFAYQVSNPEDYGVVEFDDDLRATSLVEKPASSKTNWAVPGMYIYGPGAAARAETLRPSARGELEITDLNKLYLQEGRLRARPMGRGIAWLDTGTTDNLLNAANFVQAVETRQGLIIGCPEEAAFRMGFITAEQLQKSLRRLPASPYRTYVERIVDEFED